MDIHPPSPFSSKGLAFTEVERSLTSVLGAWAVSSVVLGSAIAGVGRLTHHDTLIGFGRQTAAWGAIDGAIAGVGLYARQRRGELPPDSIAKKSRGLRRLLVVNALADVGYIASGVSIIVRARRGNRTLGMGAGDGAAMIVQGAFLLMLDASHARRLAPGANPETT